MKQPENYRDKKTGSTEDLQGQGGALYVLPKPQYTYGWLNGFGGTPSMKGKFDDWLFGRGPNEGILATAGEYATTSAIVTKYLAAAAFSEKVWVAIPIQRENYSQFGVTVTGNLNQDLNVSAWLVPEVNDENGFAGTNLNTSGGLAGVQILNNEVLGALAPVNFSMGGKDFTAGRMRPMGYLLIMMVKTSTNPTTGNVRLFVERA